MLKLHKLNLSSQPFVKLYRSNVVDMPMMPECLRKSVSGKTIKALNKTDRLPKEPEVSMGTPRKVNGNVQRHNVKPVPKKSSKKGSEPYKTPRHGNLGKGSDWLPSF